VPKIWRSHTKNIWCKDSCQEYEYLIQKYLVQRIWRYCTI